MVLYGVFPFYGMMFYRVFFNLNRNGLFTFSIQSFINFFCISYLVLFILFVMIFLLFEILYIWFSVIFIQLTFFTWCTFYYKIYVHICASLWKRRWYLFYHWIFHFIICVVSVLNFWFFDFLFCVFCALKVKYCRILKWNTIFFGWSIFGDFFWDVLVFTFLWCRSPHTVSQ